MIMKESLSYNIYVEGEVCEKLYFQHLATLINNCDYATKKVKFFIKEKISPISFYKSRINIYAQKINGKKNDGIQYLHVQDIECYDTDKDKFLKLLDELNEVQKRYKIDYQLGYTNYTFDLWIILHKMTLNNSLEHRKKYIDYINKAYGTKYTNMDDYKRASEFKNTLKMITLDDVKLAIERGKKLEKSM